MWTPALLKTKFRATLIHLGLGAILLLPLIYLICFHWFPGPFFYTDGGWQGVRLILLVDMVLGPALTFLIFNPAKTRLELGVDFSFIGAVQVLALIYGIHTVEATRIWAVAFNNEGFYDRSFIAVGKDRFQLQDLPSNAWQRFGDAPQYWVYVRRSQGEEVQRAIEAGKHGLSPDSLFFLYDPLLPHKDEVLSKALNMSRLAKLDADFAADYQEFSARHADAPGGLHFFRLVGFYRSILVALDGEGRYVGFIKRDLPKEPPTPKASAAAP